MDEDPNLDLPEIEEKEGFPWIPIVVVVAIFGLGAAWLIYGKAYHTGGDTTIAALEQQLATEKVTLEAERQKVFDLTQDLEALKQKIAAGQTPDKAAAVAQYNQLARSQNDQREKVKKLADAYNAKVSKLHELR